MRRASPLAEAERRTQRLDTEARTLAKLLHLDTRNLWPAVIDELSVEKGYEAALGAALGDDLEAPIDATAPMRWAGAAVDPADPALPAGVEALADRIEAPPELARRLGADRSHCARGCTASDADAQGRPAPGLARGRPLALGRLHGRGQCADRRGPPPRRQEPSRRHRSRAGGGTPRPGTRQAAANEPRREARSAAEAETAARARWRALQQEAVVSRDRHADAERAASRNAARLSALGEATARLTASRDEAAAARTDAQRALAALPPSADLEARLATVRGEIEGRRARLAESSAESQALAREAEISARRLTAIAADREAWSERSDERGLADQDAERASRRRRRRARASRTLRACSRRSGVR